jgi:hypothetical protein
MVAVCDPFFVLLYRPHRTFHPLATFDVLAPIYLSCIGLVTIHPLPL